MTVCLEPLDFVSSLSLFCVIVYGADFDVLVYYAFCKKRTN